MASSQRYTKYRIYLFKLDHLLTLIIQLIYTNSFHTWFGVVTMASRNDSDNSVNILQQFKALKTNSQLYKYIGNRTIFYEMLLKDDRGSFRNVLFVFLFMNILLPKFVQILFSWVSYYLISITSCTLFQLCSGNLQIVSLPQRNR